MPTSERTPLLVDATSRQEVGTSNGHEAGSEVSKRGVLPALNRIYFMAFVIGLTLSFTQSALIYSFRVMTCDEYYKTHKWRGHGDRCATPRIESDTASSVALMSSITTGCSELR